MKWYVIQVMTGTELEVRDALQKVHIPARVPQEERQIRQGGNWTGKLYVLMPGYVFLGSEGLNSDEYYTATRILGFIRFLGSPPEPITYLEAEYIGLLAPSNAPLEPSVVEVQEGSAVVLAGVLSRLPGKILKFDIRRRRAKVMLSVLGEEKTVEFAIVLHGDTETVAETSTVEPDE